MIAGNDRMLRALFRMTRARPPLDCVLAGYFSRLLGVLLTRCGEDLLAYLEVGPKLQNVQPTKTEHASRLFAPPL